MKYCNRLPLLTTLDDITLTERERQLAGAIIGEIVDIYLNYKALVFDYHRKENVSWHEARVKARRWIYNRRLTGLFF